jgi:chromosome segregation ATPase
MLVQLAQSIEAAHSATKQELAAARERIVALENRLGAGNGSDLGKALAAPVSAQQDLSTPANKELLEKDAETIAELTDRLSTMQQELLQARETIEQVSAQLAQQKAEADELRRAKEEAEAQRNRLQEGLSRQERDATREIAILREQLADARAVETDAEDQTERLKKKLAEAKAELLAEIQAHQLTRARAEKLLMQLSGSPPANRG